MWFKLTYSLASMHVLRDDRLPLQVALPGDNGHVVLWKRRLEKVKEQHLCCDAVLERSLKPEVQEMFDRLEAGFLPRDNPPVVKLPYRLGSDAVIDEAGRIPEKWSLDNSVMPRRFQGISNEVHGQLRDAVKDFVTTLRWVQGAASRHSPFAFVDYTWSRDGENWRAMPTNISVEVQLPRGIDISPKAIAVVETVLSSEEREPLGHELIREAFDIVGTHPRSALLIAVSAVETGLEGYIQFLVPNSDRILEKIASPPAMTMAQEVIPALHKKLNQANPTFPLNDAEENLLEKWVAQRNQVAHGARKGLDGKGLRDFLIFARQLLYRLDVCRGQQWAQSLAFSSDDPEGLEIIDARSNDEGR